MTDWPNNADGDVFRRLKDAGLEFSKPYKIDFNVDFVSWPPKPEAMAMLSAWFSSAKIVEPHADHPGYAEFQVFEILSYEMIVGIQMRVSKAMKPFGGVCESWGVLGP